MEKLSPSMNLFFRKIGASCVKRSRICERAFSSAFSLPLEARDSSVLTKRRWKRRSEEHTSELQSRSDLVCRLLLEKKKTTKKQQLRAVSVTTTILSTVLNT